MIHTYVAVDLETTGLNPKTDKIIEIGAVKVMDGKQTDTFSTYVNAGRQIPEHVTALTKITDDMLKEAPSTKEAISVLLDFIGDDILLGHHVIFDYSFIKKAAVNIGCTFEKQGIDTLKIARKYLPNIESRTLSSLCEYYCIPIKAHRALEDALAASKLYEALADDFYEKETFAPSLLQYKVKKEGASTKAQKERLQHLIQVHNLFVDYDIQKLTKNEASRYTDKILSKYGRVSCTK